MWGAKMDPKNLRLKLPHLGINNVSTYCSLTKPFGLQQLRLNLLIRLISDSDKLKITLNSLNFPFFNYITYSNMSD